MDFFFSVFFIGFEDFCFDAVDFKTVGFEARLSVPAFDGDGAVGFLLLFLRVAMFLRLVFPR